MAKPEYITVLIDDNLNQGWLDLCRIAPDALILGVHGQDPALRTIQYLKEWRYQILDSLHDTNATYWKGIVLEFLPIKWGNCGDLKLERYLISRYVIPAKFRENTILRSKCGHRYGLRHSLRVKSQNKILASRGHGQLVRQKNKLNLVKLSASKLIAGHKMDIVLNIPSAKNGPIKLISK